MTVGEKQKVALAEVLGCLRVILGDETTKLNTAKGLAACALASVTIISKEGRVPSLAEQKDWVAQQGWTFEPRA
jgi:hypothetical protein